MRALLIVAAVLAVVLVATSSFAIPAPARPPTGQVSAGVLPLVRPLTTYAIYTSTYIAGYAVLAVNAVHNISGDWKVPKVHGKCPSSKTETTFVGLAIGGATSTQQGFVGTETECYAGVAYHYSYWQMGSYSFTGSLAIAGGDQMHASITYNTGTYVIAIHLQDVTKGTSIAKSKFLPFPGTTDAMWVDEAGFFSSVTIVPLVDFGNVTFTNCVAKINGTTSHDLGHYSNVAIEMYNNAGTAFKAAVGTISSSNKSFDVAWKSTGP
jgi:hypothetical protein